jgi:DNA-binding NarL/FixJ family response regulator
MSKVLLADDHPLFRQALRSAVGLARPDLSIEEVGTLCAAEQALARADDFALVLLDLKMPDCGGFSGMLKLRSEYPRIPIVIVSASEGASTINRAIAFGAAGFIPKSASVADIGAALNAVLAGDIWTPASVVADDVPPYVDAIASLTPAQLRILMSLQRGLINKQIAHEMGITEGTVKAHMTAMFRKLGVSNRAQAILAAQNLAFETEIPS